MPEFLFDGKATIRALRSLADLLAARSVPHQTLIIVGLDLEHGSPTVQSAGSYAELMLAEQFRADRRLP
jgi:hypothetical protein